MTLRHALLAALVAGAVGLPPAAAFSQEKGTEKKGEALEDEFDKLFGPEKKEEPPAAKPGKEAAKPGEKPAARPTTRRPRAEKPKPDEKPAAGEEPAPGADAARPTVDELFKKTLAAREAWERADADLRGFSKEIAARAGDEFRGRMESVQGEARGLEEESAAIQQEIEALSKKKEEIDARRNAMLRDAMQKHGAALQERARDEAARTSELQQKAAAAWRELAEITAQKWALAPAERDELLARLWDARIEHELAGAAKAGASSEEIGVIRQRLEEEKAAELALNPIQREAKNLREGFGRWFRDVGEGVTNALRSWGVDPNAPKGPADGDADNEFKRLDEDLADLFGETPAKPAPGAAEKKVPGKTAEKAPPAEKTPEKKPATPKRRSAAGQ
ncbi:MAG: hypothetical protein HY719_17305 [Planctomycetes bacterium]|nr:hypothetical protein [Planctomycetota bacterium]